MGFFSWHTGDTDESIPNRYSSRDTIPIKMLDDKGNVWVERDYDGYGVFGGKDFYALIDEMNGGTGDRDRGINIAFGKGAYKSPKLVTEDCPLSWDEIPKPRTCEAQGYFYDDADTVEGEWA